MGQLQIKKILLAFDGSPLSIKGVEAGIDLASKLDAEIAVVTVVDPEQSASSIGPTRSPMQPEQLVKEIQAQAQHKLEIVRAEAGSSRFTLDFLKVGEPTAEILAGAVALWQHSRGRDGTSAVSSADHSQSHRAKELSRRSHRE